MSLANLARMNTTTTGTGTITLGSAVTGFLSFVAAGIADGQTVMYAIRDGASSEVGYGVYTSTGTTLTRNVIKSTNSDAAISLSGTAEVFITSLAESFLGQGYVAPSQITANQNDYAPGAKYSTVQLDVDAATRKITGLAGGWNGKVVTLIGDDAYPITFESASASSSAANRFNISNDFVLRKKSAMVLRHNGTNWDILTARDLESIVVAISDESTAITTGTAKTTFRMPYAFQLVGLPRANLNTVSSSGNPAFDINKNGTSIFSTTLTIDASEKTSVTATTPAVLSSTPTQFADDDEVTIDIDTAGTGAKGAKITLFGYRI